MKKYEYIDIEAVQVFLPGVDLFVNLDSTHIESMAKRMCMLRFDKGEHLIKKGDSGHYMMLVKKGQIAVILKDREVVLDKGSVVGEMSLLSGEPSRADVIAQTATEVFALHYDDFQEVMARHTEIASVMTRLMKSRMSANEGIKKLGKYKIRGQLGEGGMAIVYDAFDTELQREVAIKMLKYEIATAADFKERFLQEARIIARLNHPHILHVIETLTDYSTEFIVMEKLEGYDLSYYLNHQGVFGAKQTCEIIYQVALALAHANDQANGGIIHRDVKLSNIILHDSGYVKLMDFGLATTRKKLSDQYEGTVLYMAPELLLRQPFDHRVDIYALGITAYAMLSGNTPFRSTDINEIIDQHIKMQPPDITHFVQNIPDGLVEFIRRALEKDPDKRISSWLEIIELLKAGIGNTINLGLASNKDTAIVIKMNHDGINTDSLIKEIESLLNRNNVDYEVDTIRKEECELDITIE